MVIYVRHDADVQDAYGVGVCPVLIGGPCGTEERKRWACAMLTARFRCCRGKWVGQRVGFFFERGRVSGD